MRRPLLLALALALPVFTQASELKDETKPPQAKSPLVVHEWGTFTTIAGVDGGSIDWRPLTGHADLPTFVYTRSRWPQGIRNQNRFRKQQIRTRVRMETPVIYFYTPLERKVSVKVGFPEGTITEWYPRARSIQGGIDWGTFLIQPNARVPLLREKGESHYYPARNVDAAPIRVCAVGAKPNYEYEKFLFYRGVGKFDAHLPLVARADGNDRVVVRNRGAAPIATVIRFERKGEQVRYSVTAGLAASAGEVSLPQGKPRALGSLLADLQRALVAQGLYAKEATAMIDTWKDHWFTEGSRVFYVVPRPTTDAILPLTITPKPDETVRVMVGRIELLAPKRIRTITDLAWKLASRDEATRAAARAELNKHGRFAEPILRTVRAKATDKAHKARLGKLIDG